MVEVEGEVGGESTGTTDVGSDVVKFGTKLHVLRLLPSHPSVRDLAWLTKWETSLEMFKMTESWRFATFT